MVLAMWAIKFAIVFSVGVTPQIEANSDRSRRPTEFKPLIEEQGMPRLYLAVALSCTACPRNILLKQNIDISFVD